MKIIQTQSGEILNMDYIISTDLVEGDGENDHGHTVKFTGVESIDINGKAHTLGLYEKAVNAEEVFKLFINWYAQSTDTFLDLGIFEGLENDR